jgi:hypothetical protein
MPHPARLWIALALAALASWAWPRDPWQVGLGELAAWLAGGAAWAQAPWAEPQTVPAAADGYRPPWWRPPAGPDCAALAGDREALRQWPASVGWRKVAPADRADLMDDAESLLDRRAAACAGDAR